MNKIVLLGFLVMALMFAGCQGQTNNYTIDGNSVYVDDSNVYINVTPHTLHHSDWVEVEFESKLFSGDIDVAFGFDTDSIRPKTIERWNPHDEEKEYTCNYNFIYTTNPNYFWCYYEQTNQSGTVNITVFEHSFLSGNIPTKTAYWNVTKNWSELNGNFNSASYDFDNKNKWWYKQGQTINAGQTYKIRYYLDVKPDVSNAKYDIALKPSSETLSESIENNHLYFLDPWADYDLDTGLLAYWSFDNDQVTGDNVWDLTQQDRNGTNYSAIGNVPGILEEAFDFSPGTAIVNTSSDAELNLLNGGTVNLWANLSLLQNGGRFVNLGESADNGYTIYFDITGNIFVILINGGEAVKTTGDLNGTSGWQMVTFLIEDSPSVGSIYLNGTNVTSVGTAQDIQDAAVDSFDIGNRHERDKNFNGSIDEVGIWNRTLTESEISGLWNNGQGLEYNGYGIRIQNHTLSPSVAFTGSTLTCNATISNDDAHTMDGNITWWNNDIRDSTYDLTFSNIPNSTVINATTISGVDLTAGSTWNCSIYMELTGSSANFTTSSVERTIETVDIDNCTTYSEIIFNATLYDENTNTIVDPNVVNTTIEIDVELYDWDNGYFLGNYSNLWTNYTNATICIEDGITNETSNRIDIEASYSASNKVTEFWFLDYGNLTNQTTALNSFTDKHTIFRDLDTTDSTSFLMTFFDQDGLTQKDLIIIPYRKYIGEGVFREVERGRGDDTGETTLHLLEEDAIYYFLVTRNSTVLYTSSTFNALCQELPCSINLEASSAFTYIDEDWDLVPDGAYTVSSSNREVTLTFLANNISNWSMEIYQYSNNPENATLINASSLQSASGSIILGIPQTAGNITFVARVRRDGGFLEDSFVSLVNDLLDEFRTVGGIVLGGLLVMVIGFMALSEGAVVVIMFVVGLVIAGLLQLFEFSWQAFVTVLIMAVLLFWKLSRRNS